MPAYSRKPFTLATAIAAGLAVWLADHNAADAVSTFVLVYGLGGTPRRS